MLILLDETVQQVRIAAAETASNCASFGFHRIHEVIGCGVHAIRIYGRGDEKDAAGKKFSRSSQAIHFELHIRVVPALGFRLRPNG
jgi:hypothetical protein